MNLFFLAFVVLAFLAVVLALAGGYSIWTSSRGPPARRIAARLAALSGELRSRASIEREEGLLRLPRFNAWLNRSQSGRDLQRSVGAAGVALSLGELIAMAGVLCAFGLILPGLWGRPPVLGLGLGLVLAWLPWWYVSSRHRARVKRMERQFPEALDLMGRSMRSGQSFPSAIKWVSQEMDDPLGRDFRVLSDEINYGVPTHEALARLALRVPLPDVSYFVVAVMIQSDSGGNLAELLDKIASIVRERLKLRGDIRILSADGRLSAFILICLPFVVAAAVNFTNPEFLSVLWTDPLGIRTVVAALLLMLLGTVWMRTVIRIRV